MRRATPRCMTDEAWLVDSLQRGSRPERRAGIRLLRHPGDPLRDHPAAHPGRPLHLRLAGVGARRTLLVVAIILLFFVSMTSVFLLRVFFADRRRGRGRQTGVAKPQTRVINDRTTTSRRHDGKEGSRPMPLMVTFFNVRKGRDTLFKRGMRHLFPRTARRETRGRSTAIRFVGWFNVTEGSTWNNVVILDLPNYAVLDKLYADPSTARLRAPGRGVDLRPQAHDLPARADGPGLRVQAVTEKPGSPRIVALRELAADAELERARLPVRGDRAAASVPRRRTASGCARSARSSSSTTSRTTSSTTPSTRRGPRASPTRTRPTASGTTRSRLVDTIAELVELYNPADIFAWLIEAARDAPGHLVASRRAGPRGGAGRARRRLAGRAAAAAAGDAGRPAALAAGRRVPHAARARPRASSCASSPPTPRRSCAAPATSRCSRSPTRCSCCAPTAASRPRSTCPTVPRRS